MAAKKKSHNTTTSKRRKTTSTAKRRSNLTYFSSGKKAEAKPNPSRGRKPGRRRRRSNPLDTGTVTLGAKLGVSGLVIGFTQPVIRGFVGQFLPTGPLGSAALTLGTSYGLGALAGMTRYTSSWKRPLELAGWTIVAAQVVSSYVLPYVNQLTGLSLGGSTGASGLGRTRRRGMADIVTLPAGNYDPYYGSTPRIAAVPAPAPAPTTANKVATLKGLLTMPAMPGTSR